MPPRIKNKIIKLTDPELTGNIETDLSGDAPATPTSGPNRYTIYVPSDNATLSLGEACDADKRINEKGITGRTDTHVHFHVTQTSPTIVSLGGPVTAMTKNECVIASLDPKVPKESQGYSMVTDANAWHDAYGQHYLTSRTADIIMRAAGHESQYALVQSDCGHVEIGAGQDVIMGAGRDVFIRAHSSMEGHIETMGYDAPVAGTIKQESEESFLANCVEAFDWMQTAYGALLSGYKNVYKEPIWHTPGWKINAAKEAGTLIADLGKLALDKLRAQPDASVGKVGVSAETYVTVSAGVAASIYGGQGVTMKSPITVDLVGGTTGMKALAYATVWGGLQSAVKSAIEVVVESEWGPARLSGMRDVTISSESKGVKVGAKTNIQLAGEEQATLHGGKRLYCGSGGSTGYGLHANADKLHLGRFTQSANFSSPGPDDNKKLFFDSSRVGILHGKSSIQLYTTIIKIDAKAQLVLRSNNHDVQVKGKKIRLG
ncbi:hypothetical protein [Polyangium sp. y55x31]|uniref:hypothetical protein n=1 Tax=Polyangium sp. y55x31 TaxID=3042688 RepID=UPI002482BA8D|nr:hypothetical protein [Polyangium sp. y55x31]MDI1476531.1 hypothetical protein [Polyangium sp. y55x31]